MNPSLMDEAVDRMMKYVPVEHEHMLKAWVGLRFRQTVKVEVSRPRWMPERLYRWLWHTIVVEVGPGEVDSG